MRRMIPKPAMFLPLGGFQRSATPLYGGGWVVLLTFGVN